MNSFLTKTYTSNEFNNLQSAILLGANVKFFCPFATKKERLITGYKFGLGETNCLQGRIQAHLQLKFIYFPASNVLKELA